MITIRQIERHFSEHQHRRLYQELMTGRPEGQSGLDAELCRTIPLAAMGMIRLDELSQAHTPLYRRLLGVVLTSQQRDGGWGEPMVTAVCLRALLCGGGHGAAVERGFQSLANLQKPEGIWPKEPLRRMPGDALMSAYILLQLGEHQAFRQAVRFDDAMDWFAANAKAMDPATQRLWSHATIRCGLNTSHGRSSTLWTSVKRSAA